MSNTQNNHSQPGIAGAHGSILLVDDDERHLKSLKQLLELHDYDCDIAVGGKQAITILTSKSYDLLLLDMKMPDITGHDVMRYNRENNIDITTIIVSGETSFEDTTKALRMGAYDYIKKPYIPEELLTTINNAIQRKRLEDTNKVMQQRLGRSEKLHRYIVNNSPDIIFILDQDGFIAFINSKVETYLNFQRNELLRQHITTLVIDDDVEKAKYFFETSTDPSTPRNIDLALKNRDPNISSKQYFEITIWPITESAEDSIQQNQLYGTARDITGRVEAEEFINFQAYHDLLTRLPNRSLFKDRLSVAITHAQRQNGKLAVMFIDLDRFKMVNDSLGHTMGDRLLQAVSQRLLECTRKGDTLSRFGGDEFTLLLPDIKSSDAAEQIAQKIITQIKKPFNLSGHEVYIGASIGITLYPDSGDSLDALIKHADIAMYHVKNSGKDGYRFFERDMHTSTEERLQLERDLHRAIENNDMEVFYQPQVDTATQQVVGVEALIRWNHPQMGQLPPNEFIGIAEDSRLIIKMDQNTLIRGCNDIRKLHRIAPNLKLSVNLSPLIFEQKDLVEIILNTLEETNFPAHLLELEITENILMSDRKDIIEKLHYLNDSGVRFAIDDFGTGYSSLSYLQKLPITTLKIDRSFIHKLNKGEQDSGIIKAIVSMAKGLNMDIIAEGVENHDQLEFLNKLGCHIVQGYLFGQATSYPILVEQLKFDMAPVIPFKKPAK